MNTLTALVLLVLTFTTNALRAEAKDLLVSDYAARFIKSFKEPLYQNGANNLERRTVRLTIIRAHDDPVMITWFPVDDQHKNSFISIKKMKLIKPADPQKPEKYEIYYDEKVKLGKEQSQNLVQVLTAINEFDKLYKEGYQPPMLGGSLWVYEFADTKGGSALERKSPLATEPDSLGKIPKKRIVREMKLTAFGLMLWSLSKNGEANLY